MKLTSNSGAAQDAVAGFAGIDPGGAGQRATLGSSNVSSMQHAAKVANSIVTSVSGLISGVNAQANNVTALATQIEDRDKRDARGWWEAQ